MAKEIKEWVVFWFSIAAGVVGLFVSIYSTFISPSTLQKLEQRILKIEQMQKK
jgi:hypothetical protein